MIIFGFNILIIMNIIISISRTLNFTFQITLVFNFNHVFNIHPSQLNRKRIMLLFIYLYICIFFTIVAMVSMIIFLCLLPVSTDGMVAGPGDYVYI